MLRINNIKIEVTEPQFSTMRKYKLYLFIGQTRTSTKNAAAVSNQNTIIWKQDLPLKFGQEAAYQFQVSIDSNQQPEDKNERWMLRGKFYTQKHKQPQSKIQCDVQNAQKSKVGTLTAVISSNTQAIMDKLIRSKKNRSINSQIPSHTIPKVLRILSLIAKLNYSNSNNGQTRKLYFHIQIGEQIIKTSIINCRAAEVVFIEPRQVQIPGEEFQNTMMQVKVCNEDKGAVLGEAWMQLKDWKPAKKITLTKNTFEVGQLYIESRLANKNLIITTNYTENPHKTLSPKPINQLEAASAYRTLNPVSISSSSHNPGSLSLDLSYILQAPRSRLSPHRSSSRLDSSMISTLSSRKKSSVLNDNGTIVFSKQKRFSNYQDKQNQRISYLEGVQRSFDFKNGGVGGRYRGASFGYGNKADFVRGRNLPGVGDYKLPSIWDKY